MSVLIGYHTFGNTVFSDDSPSIRGITYSEFSGSIVDEIKLEKNANETINQKLYKGDNLQTGTITGLVSE